jgi:hypothetical protein
MTRALAIAAILRLAACAPSTSQQTDYMKGIVVSPSPMAPPAYATYPVSDAFGPRAVHLSREQRAWLLRVLRSKTYGPQRAKLRFAVLAGYKVPLVIYVRMPSQDGQDRGGHVIGQSCSSEFDPYFHGLYPGSEVSCTAPTPLPVVP